MIYLTCTTIISVNLAQYGVSLAKDWISLECGTISFTTNFRCYVATENKLSQPLLSNCFQLSELLYECPLIQLNHSLATSVRGAIIDRVVVFVAG